MDNEKELNEFWRELRALKDNFVIDVGKLCIKYGTELIPLSFDEIDKILNLPLNKLLDRDFRRAIECKVKKTKKELNPLWRKIRKWFGG